MVRVAIGESVGLWIPLHVTLEGSAVVLNSCWYDRPRLRRLGRERPLLISAFGVTISCTRGSLRSSPVAIGRQKLGWHCMRLAQALIS